jgi:hypothetical protein
VSVAHHEPPEDTRPEPLDDRTLYDGDWSVCCTVVFVVARVVAGVVVGVVVAVVDCVAAVDCVVACVAAVDCVVVWVAAVEVPENERAASTDRAPVRARPPATAPLVMVEMRRRPALRRAMGSGLMRLMIGCVPPPPLWTFWELAETGDSQESLRIRSAV